MSPFEVQSFWKVTCVGAVKGLQIDRFDSLTSL